MDDTINIKNRLYLEYHDKVHSFVRSKINNESEVDDIVSTIFLKVCEKYESYDMAKASESTWIYTISRNTVIDFYRKRQHLSLEGSELDFASEEEIEESYLKSERLEELANALERLSERERDIIILCYYKNITLKDIAVRIGMSYSNIKIVHKKALDKLNRMLKV